MLLQDLRYALRQLRRSPGFAFTVVITLALGVGVATAVFCVIDTVVLSPLPYAHPEKIVFPQATARAGYSQPASWPSFKDERAQVHAFSAFAGYSDFQKITMETPSNGPVALDYVRSTDNFFQVFGVNPLFGRTFLPGEEQEGKSDVVVLSYDNWQTYFGGDRNVLNRAVKLNGRTFTIIGVMPAGFRYPLNQRNSIYIPRLIDQDWMQNRGSHWLRTIARVKDGVSTEQAQADLSQVFSNLGTAYPQTDAGRVVRVEPLNQFVTSKSKGPLWILLAAVFAVLAIGCVNVAGLLLARGVKRQREMAMRTAVGAGRIRLVRQVLTEGLVLAAMGAAGGMLLAWAMLGVMSTFLAHALARGADIHLNWAVLSAAAGLAIVSSLAATLYPALRMTSVDPNRALKAGGSAGTERGQHRLRSGFVITQVALTLLLLVVAGMLVRVVTRFSNSDLGFDPSHVLSVKLSVSRARYLGRDPIGDFYRPLEERVRHLPGVKAAGLIDILPIESWGNNGDVHIAGQPPYPPQQEMLAENRMVSLGYFDVLQIPLHGGRQLSQSIDRPENAAGTVVVNDAFVRKFIPPGLNPSLQRIDDAAKEAEWTQIVGVTGNIRQNIYDQPLAERDFLMDELPIKSRADSLADMSLLVRTSGDPAEIVPAIRNIVHGLDPTVALDEPRAMTDVVAETLVFERMEGWLFSIFAALALALALVGLYGLVSHEVEQGARDTGVRMALGATRSRILSMVLKRVAWMLAAGTAVGLVLTLLARKVIGMVIYFEAQHEAGSFLLLALLLVAAGLLAALIPAVRAASIEPMQALRSE